jgi:hypothetical protein
MILSPNLLFSQLEARHGDTRKSCPTAIADELKSSWTNLSCWKKMQEGIGKLQFRHGSSLKMKAHKTTAEGKNPRDKKGNQRLIIQTRTTRHWRAHLALGVRRGTFGSRSAGRPRKPPKWAKVSVRCAARPWAAQSRYAPWRCPRR